jgi:hypothetical protein
VVVGDLYIEGVAPLPSEADSPLVVDPNAVLSCPVSLQALQPVAWGHSEVLYAFRRVE